MVAVFRALQRIELVTREEQKLLGADLHDLEGQVAIGHVDQLIELHGSREVLVGTRDAMAISLDLHRHISTHLRCNQ